MIFMSKNKFLSRYAAICEMMALKNGLLRKCSHFRRYKKIMGFWMQNDVWKMQYINKSIYLHKEWMQRLNKPVDIRSLNGFNGRI